MNDKPIEPWRFRSNVAEALDAFDSSYMQEVWARALARRESEPEAAVTTARTLLESVCKHILYAANPDARPATRLPQLYEQTANVLNIAPTEKLGPVFSSMFTACVAVIEGIGTLRNELSDAHGRGPFGTMPEWRHSELAVNLSGAMATYLAAVWKGRQPTVAHLIQAYQTRPFSKQIRYPLDRMTRDLGHLIASKLRKSDLVSYFQEHAAKTQNAPSTMLREFNLLRAALDGNSSDAFDDAAEMLKRSKVLPQEKHVTVIRRVSQGDFEVIVNYLREQGTVSRDRKYLGLAASMADIVRFAIGSGRTPAEIFKLRWADVDFQNGTCKLPGKGDTFPILGEAWTVIETRRASAVEPEGRIFPFRTEGAVQRHMLAVRALVAEGKLSRAVRFVDYRHEAAHRLLESGHRAEVVSRATGLTPLRIHKIAEQL